MLIEADGFPYESTPTNDRHITYLRSLTSEVKGISLNSNLYTQKEKKKAYESDEDCVPNYSKDHLGAMEVNYGRSKQREE